MTKVFPSCPNSIDWRPLYRSAILETNKRLIPHRVLDAEAAVIARAREIFYVDGTAQEKEALEDARYVLHAFKSALQHSEAA